MLVCQGNRVLTKEAFVPALADPDVIGVNNKEKRPACSPSSFRRRPPDGIGAGPPSVTWAIVAGSLCHWIPAFAGMTQAMSFSWHFWSP